MKAGIFRNTKSGELLYVGKDRGIRAFTAGGKARVMGDADREEFKVRAKGEDVLIEDGTLCQRVDYGLAHGASGVDPAVNLHNSIVVGGTDADKAKVGVINVTPDSVKSGLTGKTPTGVIIDEEHAALGKKVMVESTPTRVGVDQFKATFDAARDAMKALGDQAKVASQNFQQFRSAVLHPKEGRDHGWCGKQAARKHRKRGHIVRKIANGEYSWER